MDLVVKNPNLAVWGTSQFRCAVGRGGITAAEEKREGDGKTPAGKWRMRHAFYRADRIAKPETLLSIRALGPDEGWCENPADLENYNRLIKCPYDGGHQTLWRDDHLFDIIVVLGHNDEPVKIGFGSAIFLHVARPNYGPSAGCITLQMKDLLVVLREADKNSHVEVLAP